MNAQEVRESDELLEIGQLKDDVVEDDDSDWEEGDIDFNGANGGNRRDSGKDWNGEVTVQIEEGSAGNNSTLKRKPSQRRATAKDKEFAEIVHKTHLLCLLARGRIVDAACNDPLLQASILSILPPSLGISVDATVRSTNFLGGLVRWFMTSFRVILPGERSSSSELEFSRRLQQAMQSQAGSAEEVAALAVAVLRSLGFTTRYVTVLDVVPLKPDANSLEASEGLRPGLFERGAVFSSQGDLETKKVASLAQILAKSAPRQESGSQKFNVLRGTSSGSLPTDSECKDGGERAVRSRGDRGGDHRLNYSDKSGTPGDTVLRDSKPAPGGRGKLKGTGSHHGKFELPSRSHDLFNVSDEPGAETSGPKRNGDEEFERQLAMAIAATAAAAEQKNLQKRETLGGVKVSPKSDPFSSAAKRLKGIKGLGNNGNSNSRQKPSLTPKREGAGSSGGAIWSRKLGPVMHWAEVYCSGAVSTGRWVHVDAARGMVDGADKVEGAAAACGLPLRYVIAFAGSGAKDVTRRYVTLWSSVGHLRVDQGWWDNTLHPLKQLEAVATAAPASTFSSGQAISLQSLNMTATTTNDAIGLISKLDRSTIHESVPIGHPQESASKSTARESILDHNVNLPKVDPTRQPTLNLSATHVDDRSALEDMEMDTKTFTEPLPTNQQAYKSHHLYVIERWLTKYQMLYPKGPVLGYCGGHPVYPRTCVQVLHTPDHWLREGFKVKSGESPAKVVKALRFTGKEVESAIPEPDGTDGTVSTATMTALYGKWQTQAWQPPRATDGIVPKNERGQVDVWSEKCIPPGTVHLRFPRLVPIVQKLQIDFAPAMVGFEVRKGRSFPVYEGLVVCEEFKDLILDAHNQQEEERFRELWKKREENAAKRWRHLLHSMATRQRLKAAYEIPVTSELEHRELLTSGNVLEMAESSSTIADVAQPSNRQSNLAKEDQAQKHRQRLQLEHVHHFPEEMQSYAEDTGIRTKQCSCGFTYYVEEM